MTVANSGLFWCLVFLVLDALQAVYFGSAFQDLDSFLVGALVFGLSATFCLAWSWRRYPGQVIRALASARDLVGLNVSAAAGWVAYLLAIQLIEPAVAFTIFSGMIPLAALAIGRLGFDEGGRSSGAIERLGYAVLAVGIAVLSAITLAGWSGFVRGGTGTALGGLALAAAAGIGITYMLAYSRRLDRAGVGPLAQAGLRFPLYVVLAAAGATLGLDDKGPVDPGQLGLAVLAGLALLAFPIYAVQKAVALTSTLTIGVVAAVTPLLVFILQTLEGRVDYAPATLGGLLVYFAGALAAVIGSFRAVRRRRP